MAGSTPVPPLYRDAVADPTRFAARPRAPAPSAPELAGLGGVRRAEPAGSAGAQLAEPVGVLGSSEQNRQDWLRGAGPQHRRSGTGAWDQSPCLRSTAAEHGGGMWTRAPADTG